MRWPEFPPPLPSFRLGTFGRYALGMETKELFGMAMGITEPWFVAKVELDLKQRQLEIAIDFRRGGVFPCPECGAAGCKAYDTDERRWRHLDFFQYRTDLTARVPRVSCGKCGVKPVGVPWARPGSGFTLLFEALVLLMAADMPMAAVGRVLREHDTRLWRLTRFHVNEARERRDDRQVRWVGVDETSSRKGHDYISLFVDLEQRRVLFATPGKDAGTVARFRSDLEQHGGSAEHIEEVCCDMSAAFVKGVTESLPEAEITFDKFHVTQIISAAVDETRRTERAAFPELKGQRYALLRNPETMSDEQLGFASELLLRRSSMKTARAFHLKLVFQDFYAQPRRSAEAFLHRWCAWAQRSRVPAMVAAAGTIRRHWRGILRWFTSRISNGILEGINSLVQAAKAKARGYRSSENLITMVYLIIGRLDFNVTHLR